MGKVKYLKEVREFFEKTPVVNVRDIRLITQRKDYTYQLLRNLVKQGEINRVTRGYYTTYGDPVVAVFCFRPAYLGLQEALSIHNLWEQETNVVIVTVKKVRVGVREILGTNVVLHRIDPKYFFGFELIRYGDFYVPVSDLEKTLIDLVYFNELPDKEVIRRIRERADLRKLNQHLKTYPKRIKQKVLDLIGDC